jgi:hypothetical protein
MGTPQFALLALGFPKRSVSSESTFGELLRSGRPVRILELTHSTYSGRDDWFIQVFPILSEWKYSVRQALDQVGLPSLAAWLRATGPDAFSFTLLWSPTKSDLVIERFPAA